MRKTKIICTIGPASQSEEILRQMVQAGMNVARLNFSHDTHEAHLKKIKLLQKVREDLHVPLAIMLDTKGPEFRTGVFKKHRAVLKEGQQFIFTMDDIEGDETRVSVNYKNMIRELRAGDRILVCNGLVVCDVTEIKGNDIITRVVAGGEVGDHKSMNFPGKVLKNAYLSEQDKQDLLFGIQNEVDFVAASFVSSKEDARSLRDFLDANGGEDIDIIAKIENRSGVDNIDSICEVVDGIMVARGDLGVEIPQMEVPAVQKEIVEKCRLLGKRVIIATEMLESMIHNIRPTRAEISDVANAVYDGASAIMLSGESAAGEHPVEAVRTMAEDAEYTEKHIHYENRFKNQEFRIKNTTDAISHAVCSMAIDVHAKGIVVSSVSGKTVRMVSRFRCPVQIIGMTTSPRAYRKLALSWGVLPILCEKVDSLDVLFYHALQASIQILNLQIGDNIVMTGGSIGFAGSTNQIKVETIQKLPAGNF